MPRHCARAPLVLHVCTPLPEQRVAPGAPDAGAPARHARLRATGRRSAPGAARTTGPARRCPSTGSFRACTALARARDARLVTAVDRRSPVAVRVAHVSRPLPEHRFDCGALIRRRRRTRRPGSRTGSRCSRSPRCPAAGRRCPSTAWRRARRCIRRRRSSGCRSRQSAGVGVAARLYAAARALPCCAERAYADTRRASRKRRPGAARGAQLPVASQVRTPLPEHCVVPGVQTPVQACRKHAAFVQGCATPGR